MIPDIIPPAPPLPTEGTKPDELQTQQSVKKKVERLVDDLEKAKETARQAAKQ